MRTTLVLLDDGLLRREKRIAAERGTAVSRGGGGARGTSLTMLMPDVNVLVHAHGADVLGHSAYRAWLEGIVADSAPFALSELVAVGSFAS